MPIAQTLLHEFDHVRQLLDEKESHRAQHTLKRILTILKVMVAQLDILETDGTMTRPSTMWRIVLTQCENVTPSSRNSFTSRSGT